MQDPTPRKTPPGDRQHATYRHEIALANQRVSRLTGYSKFVGNDEAHDKHKLLVDYVSRLVRNGYLQKSFEIVFYTNKGIGNDYDDVLLELYPRTYKAHGAAKLNLGLTRFLSELYAAIAAHGSEAGIEKAKAMATYVRKPEVDAHYKFDRNLFKTHDDLVRHCQRLITEGHRRPRVEGYYYKYMEIFPHTSPPKTSNAPNSATPLALQPSPDNQAQQQNYQANLAQLAAKFNAK